MSPPMHPYMLVLQEICCCSGQVGLVTVFHEKLGFEGSGGGKGVAASAASLIFGGGDLPPGFPVEGGRELGGKGIVVLDGVPVVQQIVIVIRRDSGIARGIFRSAETGDGHQADRKSDCPKNKGKNPFHLHSLPSGDRGIRGGGARNGRIRRLQARVRPAGE